MPRVYHDSPGHAQHADASNTRMLVMDGPHPLDGPASRHTERRIGVRVVAVSVVPPIGGPAPWIRAARLIRREARNRKPINRVADNWTKATRRLRAGATAIPKMPSLGRRAHIPRKTNGSRVSCKLVETGTARRSRIINRSAIGIGGVR